MGPTPCLIVHPDHGAPTDLRARPWLLWMHGRTAHKELDNGRYLRLLRSGVATVAIDLPGHGERTVPELQASERTMEVAQAALVELPGLLASLGPGEGLDPDRCAIGGMSLGGMVALAALCRPHRFKAAWVEATTGDWSHLNGATHDPVRADAMEPARHLDRWMPIPLLAIHSELDEWIPIADQRRFLDRVRDVNGDAPVEMLAFPRTGAAHEHIGFGSCAPQAKEAGVAFLTRHLGVTSRP